MNVRSELYFQNATIRKKYKLTKSKIYDYKIKCQPQY